MSLRVGDIVVCVSTEPLTGQTLRGRTHARRFLREWMLYRVTAKASSEDREVRKGVRVRALDSRANAGGADQYWSPVRFFVIERGPACDLTEEGT